MLIFYNDKASFNHFLEMMRSERNRMDDSSPLCYHIELVSIQSERVSGFSGEGKVSTEITFTLRMLDQYSASTLQPLKHWDHFLFQFIHV